VTHVGYLVAGYGLTTAVLVAYVLRLRSRSRALAPRTPAARGPAGEAATTTPSAPADAPIP
jgi:hypothetical protein